ncbi:MAG TPA: hypothetical protein VH374_18915 [Polyangia bacterium]|jgi:hypothetical protein|nr:hypothetical protein [Polyangia bacterium]
MTAVIVRRVFVAALALGFAGMGVVAPVQASLVVALDLSQLVSHADHIVVTDVVSVQAAWDAKHERIVSTIQLNVVESWKGPATPQSRITVVQPGGTVDDITMVVFGMTQFRPGERSLVFLRGSMTAASVVGMAQGKRALFREAATGRWMADGPDRSGALFLRPDAATPAAATAATENALRRRALDDLHQDIRAMMKAGR